MSSDNAKETGCVKWFNNKSGYGFIHSCDSDDDVFVHHTSLSVTLTISLSSCWRAWRYSKPASNDHDVATNVTGVRESDVWDGMNFEQHHQKLIAIMNVNEQQFFFKKGKGKDQSQVVQGILVGMSNCNIKYTFQKNKKNNKNKKNKFKQIKNKKTNLCTFNIYNK